MRSGQKTPIAWWSNRGVKSLTKLLVWLLYVAFGHELSTSNEISPNYTLFPPTWEQNKAEDARRMRKINCAAWPTPIANLPWTDAGWLYLSLFLSCAPVSQSRWQISRLLHSRGLFRHRMRLKAMRALDFAAVFTTAVNNLYPRAPCHWHARRPPWNR